MGGGGVETCLRFVTGAGTKMGEAAENRSFNTTPCLLSQLVSSKDGRTIMSAPTKIPGHSCHICPPPPAYIIIQWLEHQGAPDSSNPVQSCKTLGKVFRSTMLQFTQASCMVKLAIDSSGCFCTNSLRALIAAWLYASHRRRYGV